MATTDQFSSTKPEFLILSSISYRWKHIAGHNGTCCNPSSEEVDAKESWVWGQPELGDEFLVLCQPGLDSEILSQKKTKKQTHQTNQEA